MQRQAEANKEADSHPGIRGRIRSAKIGNTRVNYWWEPGTKTLKEKLNETSGFEEACRFAVHCEDWGNIKKFGRPVEILVFFGKDAGYPGDILGGFVYDEQIFNAIQAALRMTDKEVMKTNGFCTENIASFGSCYSDASTPEERVSHNTDSPCVCEAYTPDGIIFINQPGGDSFSGYSHPIMATVLSKVIPEHHEQASTVAETEQAASDKSSVRRKSRKSQQAKNDALGKRVREVDEAKQPKQSKQPKKSKSGKL
jgi:hypothetical protein